MFKTKFTYIKITISPAASQVVGLKDPSQQKIGYNLLSTKDKTEIWSQRMSDVLDTKPLNLKQREFIIRLKGIISQELFTENSQKNLQYKSAFENHLKEEILSLFELKTAKSFFASLETLSRDADNINNEEPPDDCECSTSSDYCNYHFDCDPLGCTQVGGCGTLLLYTCNGWCFPE